MPKRDKIILAVVAAVVVAFGIALGAARVANGATCSKPSWSTSCSWQRTFSDGFGGTSLKTQNWTPGWFGSGTSGPVNSEETADYSSKNVVLGGGSVALQLHIGEHTGGFNNTGALISTNSHKSFAPPAGGQLGIEWKACLSGYGPHGLFDWPALWVNRDGGNESDIMEGLEGDASAHFHPGSFGVSPSGAWEGCHKFGEEWSPHNFVKYYYDGVKIGEYRSSSISGSPMYLVADMTVNGDPQEIVKNASLIINWVRVWQR